MSYDEARAMAKGSDGITIVVHNRILNEWRVTRPVKDDHPNLTEERWTFNNGGEEKVDCGYQDGNLLQATNVFNTVIWLDKPQP